MKLPLNGRGRTQRVRLFSSEKERYDMSKEELKELLVKEAWEGQKNSYSPYSKFPVGAAVM